MAKKGGDKRLKRQLAPRFWQVNRKSPRFILNTMPGPHTRKLSYPIGVVLRDLLHVCSSIREVKRSLNKGLITVDGKMIHHPNFPVGLVRATGLMLGDPTCRLHLPEDTAQRERTHPF